MVAVADDTIGLERIIEAASRGPLSGGMIARALALGPEAVRAAMLAANSLITEQSRTIARLQGRVNQVAGPNAPSSATPVFLKPDAGADTPAGRKRRQRPGGRPGHAGRRRPAPPIDRHVALPPLPSCPCCRGAVAPSRRSRRRDIEDIPQEIKVEATRYDIPQHWCAHCRKYVEPVVDAALPNATLGHRVAALTSWFHYGLGLCVDQVVQIMRGHLRSAITPGGLVDLWQRTGTILKPWYDAIGGEARSSAVLHADETGWRVNGATHWLWCFCNGASCYYMIDQGRGVNALLTFFTDAFEGVLIHDFYAAYESVFVREHQCCLAHLLRALAEASQTNASPEWLRFCKHATRLIQDGLRLKRRPDFTPEKHAGRIRRLNQRLIALADAAYADPDASRLAARLARHRDNIFTFLDYEGVDPTNNHAERMIRPAVMVRKVQQGNRSERGAQTQAIWMTLYRTLRLRGHDPTSTIAEALRIFVRTGELPPLPPPRCAPGLA